jgi:hypothetical protein
VLCPVGPDIKQSNLNLPSRSFVNSQDRRLSLVNAHSLIHPSARRPISMLLDAEHAIQSHTVPEGPLPWPSPSGATASWWRHLCAGTALVMRCVQAPATQVHRGPRPGALLPGQQAREVPCGAQALQRGEHAAHSEGGRPGAVGRDVVRDLELSDQFRHAYVELAAGRELRQSASHARFGFTGKRRSSWRRRVSDDGLDAPRLQQLKTSRQATPEVQSSKPSTDELTMTRQLQT